MKQLFPTLLKLATLIALLGSGGCGQTATSGSDSTNKTSSVEAGGGSADHSLTLEQRRAMSVGDRLRWLEKNGEVPDDADTMDWHLAQRASWWGKPIDPKCFWKDRVIWMDKSAIEAAKRLGRGYPPMPYEDSSLPKYPDDDGIRWDSYEIEGQNIHFAGSSKENAFWDKFIKTKPNPPERIGRDQFQVANTILGNRYRFEQEGNPARTNPQRLAHRQESEIGQAQMLGCPAEALSEEALFWAYVMKQREEYAAYIAPLSGINNMVVTNWIRRLFVDRKYVTEPISEDQIKAANAWKITYLQRLRREKVDESYINAYLKAWKLSTNQVFEAK